MRYQLASAKATGSDDGPLVVLEHLGWDDHGHRNTYQAYLRPTPCSDLQPLGELKILQRGSKRPRLPESFTSLPEDYCSLGQSLEYYERLETEGELGSAVQRDLRDLVQAPTWRYRFVDDDGYSRSLLRFPSARYLLARASDQLPESLDLRITTKLPGLAEAHLAYVIS